MHPYVNSSIIYNGQYLETAQVSNSRGVIKKDVHLTSGIILSCKSESNLTLCDNVDGPGDYYTK